MPQIPTYDAPKVQQAPLQTPKVNLDISGTNGEQVAQGVQNLGQGVAQAVSTIQQVRLEEQQKANQMQVLRAKNDVSEQTLQAEKQLYMLKGQAALDATESTYDTIKKAQEKAVATQTFNPDQKRMLQQSLAPELEATHKSIEMHFAQQSQVVQQANVAGSIALGKDKIALNFAQPDVVGTVMKSVEDGIRKNQESKTDGDADIAKWREDAHSTVLNQYLEARDWKGAETYLAGNRKELGDAGGQYEYKVNLLKDQQMGQVWAQLAVHTAINKDSKLIDESKLGDQIEQVPPAQRKAFIEALVPIREQAERSNKALIASNYTNAFTVLLKTRSLSGVDVNTKAWLTQYAPKEWFELEQKQHEMVQRGKRAANEPDSPDERRAKVEALNDLAVNATTWNSMGKDALPAFLKKYGDRLSDKGIDATTGQLDGVIKKSGLQDLKGQSENVIREVTMKAFNEKRADPKTWKQEHADLYDAVYDRVNTQSREWSLANGGKQPNREQVEQWSKELVVKGKVEGTGIFFDSTATKIEAEMSPKYQGKTFKPNGAPEAKAITGYRYTKTRSRRAPIFSDGTQGPLEDANGN